MYRENINRISLRHPLRKLFTGLTEINFYGKVGLCDPGIVFYVSELLIEFVHVDSLYKIRDSQGKKLDDIGEMLLEEESLAATRDFDRERLLHKHIGDYTLFITGLFPESLKPRPRSIRLDYFLDYVKVGKKSYSIVSQFNQARYRKEAPLFRALSENFDLCVVGLNFVKKDLERLKNPYYLRAKRIIS
ncbi:MAG: hypothetical protein ACE5K3_11365 [bacterium]